MDFNALLALLPVNVIGYLTVASYVIAAAAVLAATIAKLTPNTTDDKLAAALEWLHDLLVKVVPAGATLSQKRGPVPAPELAPVIRSRK
jgi:hypothetical protein